jgi:hypothetical protein
MQKQNTLYFPLFLLGLIQISSAIFFMLPDFIVETFGFKTVGVDLIVYRYVVCSLYFSLGILYLLGAYFSVIQLSALIIVCIDIPLEILSYWIGFPSMSLPYWLIFLFSVILVVPSAFCFFHLITKYSKNKDKI